MQLAAVADDADSVSGGDFLIYRRDFGAVTNNATGDANGSGGVDDGDLAV
jgi:hypothetical protein